MIKAYAAISKGSDLELFEYEPEKLKSND